MTGATQNHRLSFEFFPPKTDTGREKLGNVCQQLSKLNPSFFSCTYGAGGSTRDETKNIVGSLQQFSNNISVAPHLSFGTDGEPEMLQLLESYAQMGVDKIVALRGDLPSGMGRAHQLVYANELVAFIREHFGNKFELEVAAYPEIHPQAASYEEDIHYLKGKFDAGADGALTQYFYNTDAYFYFIDKCAKEGIEKPIVPGIMPITNFRNLQRFSANCGAEIPRWIVKKLEKNQDDIAATTEAGVEIVTSICEKLLAGGAPGLHFFTMNTVDPSQKICQNLGFDAI